MGASSSLAKRVHTAPSYAARVSLIEDAFDNESMSPIGSMPDLNEQTDNSGQTLLMRITQTFMSKYHPDWRRIRRAFLRAVTQLTRPNTPNRDGDTIINVIFQSMTSIQSELLNEDEEIFDFFYTLTRHLIALGRPKSPLPSNSDANNPLLARVSCSLPDVVKTVDDLAAPSPMIDNILALCPNAFSPILDVNHRSVRFNQCPLHSILYLEHEMYAFQFLLLLLDANVDLAPLNEDGQTFLHTLVAITYGVTPSPSSSASPAVAPNDLPTASFPSSLATAAISTPLPSIHVFEGQRLHQVFDLLLQPSHALARGNWSQKSGDWWTLNSSGLTFIQFEKQLYKDAQQRRSSNVSSDTGNGNDNDASWSRISTIHDCCAAFETDWLTTLRPQIRADVELTIMTMASITPPNSPSAAPVKSPTSAVDEAVKCIMTFIDGYP